MFIYGVVWVNRFDIAYAIGFLTWLIFDVSFSDACPSDSGIPTANSPDFDPNKFDLENKKFMQIFPIKNKDISNLNLIE